MVEQALQCKWVDTLLPKIFFKGKYTSGQNTISNNSSTVFEAKRFAANGWSQEDFKELLKARNIIEGPFKDKTLGCNPEGDNSFSFKDVIVTGCVNSRGESQIFDPLHHHLGSDSILGLHLNVNVPPAKIVNNDVEFQDCCAMYGLQIQVANKQQENVFGGKWDPQALCETTQKNVQMRSRQSLGSIYKSVLTGAALKPGFDSLVANSISAMSDHGDGGKNKMTSKLVTHSLSYHKDQTEKVSGEGEIIGYIEPYLTGMPIGLATTRVARLTDAAFGNPVVVCFRCVTTQEQKYFLELDLSNAYRVKGDTNDFAAFSSFKVFYEKCHDNWVDSNLSFDPHHELAQSQLLSLGGFVFKEIDQSLFCTLKYKRLRFIYTLDDKIQGNGGKPVPPQVITEPEVHIFSDSRNTRVQPGGVTEIHIHTHRFGRPSQEILNFSKSNFIQDPNQNIPICTDLQDYIKYGWPSADFRWPNGTHFTWPSQPTRFGEKPLYNQPKMCTDYERTQYLINSVVEDNKIVSWNYKVDTEIFKISYIDQQGHKQPIVCKHQEVKTGFCGPLTVYLELDSRGLQGNPRFIIGKDSFPLSINYFLKGTKPTEIRKDQRICTLLFESRTPDQINNPDWHYDVGPAIKDMVLLQPMQLTTSLYEFTDATRVLNDMKIAMQADFNEGSYLPTTREWSLQTFAMVKNWLYSPMYVNPKPGMECFTKITTPEELKTAIQGAITLEMAPIPMYMSGLYSIVDQESSIAKKLRNIMIQEMYHLALACNLLISIGGVPQIANPANILKYDGVPGKLPVNVLPNVGLRVGPLNKNTVKDFYMAFESPPEVAVDTCDDDKHGCLSFAFNTQKNTIGECYKNMRLGFEHLDSIKTERGGSLLTEIFEKNKVNQYKQWSFNDSESVLVEDLTSALKAISTSWKMERVLL